MTAAHRPHPPSQPASRSSTAASSSRRSSPRDPVAAYITLDEALPRGLLITEASDAGSRARARRRNPLDERVLLYDGEELVGAKQNRILNVTVLVEAKWQLPIPVSCVEQGRWSRRSVAFDAAPHVSHPSLRRRKAERSPRRRSRAGWLRARCGTPSRRRPRACASIADRRERGHLPAHGRASTSWPRRFPLEPGQCGAMLALGDTLCLDWVSRPEAFAQLWPKLRRGYLLDALERARRPASRREPDRRPSSSSVGERASTRQPSAGLGEDVRLRGAGVIGSGLELDGELLQLSAFTSDGGADRAFGRIARPSRRA